MLPGMLDIRCISHGACLAGEKFECDLLNQISELWSYMIKTSQAARNAFQVCGLAQQPPVREQALHKAKVKWFATWMMWKQMFRRMCQFMHVVNHDREFCVATRNNIRTLLGDVATFELELAFVVDAGKPLVELCYLQEGDGFLSPGVYNMVMQKRETLARAVGQSSEGGALYAPCLLDTAVRQAGGNVQLAESKIVATILKGPVLQKLDELINGVWREQLVLFRLCRLLDIKWVQMKEIGFLENELRTCQDLSRWAGRENDLRGELVLYKQTLVGLEHVDNIVFWRTQRDTLPHLYALAKFAATVQPSSAAAERVFAMLAWMFTDQQEGTYEDYKSTAAKLRYNTCWRQKKSLFPP